MDRVDALFRRERDDAFHVQVGLHGTLPLSDQVRFVRLEPVQAEPVFLRIDCDRAQTQFGRRAKDTDGDLAAIQGQQFFQVQS